MNWEELSFLKTIREDAFGTYKTEGRAMEIFYEKDGTIILKPIDKINKTIKHNFEYMEENRMKIYIIERDNPSCKPEPEVFIDRKLALDIVKSEYNLQMEELGISQEKSDAGYGSCGCYWNFDDNGYCGDCLIDSDNDGDRWEWRITEHEIEF